MSARILVALACLAAAAAGCGGDDDNDRAQRPPTPVQLDVNEPNDMAVVQNDAVEVQGTVEPAGATVRVMGERADVSGGTFRASVGLEPGPNVIDVIATARGRATAMTAFRVTRELPVKVPDLDGLEVQEVEQQLADAGLKPDINERTNLIEELLPGEPAVCEQNPEPGTEVRRGTTVHVEVAKSC
jgi:PASTA domain-containing protein/glucodextranase-like protein